MRGHLNLVGFLLLLKNKSLSGVNKALTNSFGVSCKVRMVTLSQIVSQMLKGPFRNLSRTDSGGS